MKRVVAWSSLVVCVALVAPIVRADVKTSQRTQVKLAGMAGALMNRFGGAAAKDGLTSTIAVKGARKSSLNDLTGEIIDLNEQKVYTVDMKKKEYTVKTFAEIRAAYEKARADAQKNMQNAAPADKPQPQDNAKQMQFDVDVHETGQHKTILGRDTHEVVLSITGHEKGKKLEESGGFVMTNDMWLGPTVAALDEVHVFDLKYFEAIYGESIAMDMQQLAQMSAMYPSFQSMAGQMQTEGTKLKGTPLSTTTTFDSVKSPDQMKAASDQQAQQSSGGGIGGMFARKLAGNKGNSQDARTTAMTTTMDVLSIDTAVSDADVAVPAGFKEKK